ncbi:MAG: TRAM domain-containing protein, partial [Erysipelotrichaceae bacterium]|nr:TRAM domain-containing protein [Erysipelotrichaceae bacterium]
SRENGERYIGTVQEVLVEKKDSLRNIYFGRSRHHAPDEIDGHIRFTSDREIELGTFVNVRIVKAEAYDWEGKLA